ncbi:MAG: hypothetical protein AB7I27_06885 [Bacteriovoracaceae bacterium]
MKNIIYMILLLTTSVAAIAACPESDKFKAKQATLRNESEKLLIVADYLNSRLKERRGEYENSQDITSLMIEVRTKSMRLANESAKLQMKISNELLRCVNAN